MRNVSTIEMRESGAPAKRRSVAWIALLIFTLAALALVLIPAWLIQPFRPQSQTALAVSYTLRRWSPLFTVLDLIIVLALVVWLWRGSRRWWLKSLLILPLGLTLLATWFARQNHFEWMFNPLSSAAYARAGEVNFLTDMDMVLAIEVNGEAVAYPVRLMAYHHLVEDTVGGKHIVATY
jgi:phosphoglycerol transferase MdoB-like AlkP superfamily enzyme